MLEKGHTTGVTMGTDYLATQAELVNSQENGLEHNHYALVSVLEVQRSLISFLFNVNRLLVYKLFS